MSTTQLRSIRTIALVAAIAMTLSACGRIGTSDPITVTWDPVESDASDSTEAAAVSVAANVGTGNVGTDIVSTDIVFEPAGQAGQNPFSPVMLIAAQAFQATLADPDPIAEVEIIQPDPGVRGFCDTWEALAPSMLGGPGGDIDAYLDQLVAAFTALIAAAEQEGDFPDWAMDDFVAYLEDLTYAAEAGDLSGGDTALGNRVEGFLSRYCDVSIADAGDTDQNTDLTHVEGS